MVVSFVRLSPYMTERFTPEEIEALERVRARAIQDAQKDKLIVEEQKGLVRVAQNFNPDAAVEDTLYPATKRTKTIFMNIPGKPNWHEKVFGSKKPTQ
jgi:hypothetical protein